MYLSQQSKPILSLFLRLIPAAQKGFWICSISFSHFQTNVTVKDLQWGLSLSISCKLNTGDDVLFLIFPKLSLQIKSLFLIYYHTTSAGLKGRMLIGLSPLDEGSGGSGLQTLQQRLIPIILWGQGRMPSDTAYQSKNTEKAAAKKRGQGQNRHCHCASFARWPHFRKTIHSCRM